jgi:CDP-diacylglycerol--glycerol-3-phosphate 3-phosphatidyltransferase/cardiolipin synthase
VSESSPGLRGEQASAGGIVADTLTVLRIPMAVAFVLAPTDAWRMGILIAAATTDLLDGPIARRFGSSRFGVLLDPVADKLFMAAAFGVVLASGRLSPFEVAGVLLRDIVATIAFVVTALTGRAATIPARLGGKAVTVAQLLTLVAFLADSPHLHSLAWATTAVALYAIYDYARAARTDRRAVGS